MEKFGKALIWDELVELYDSANHGRPARTLPMDLVFQWAKRQKDKFEVRDDGTIHKIQQAD